MALYEVNLTFEDEATSNEFFDWLSEEHIADMLRLPGFLTGKVLRDTEKPTQLTCVYTLKSMEDMDNYLKQHAPKMREPAMKRFGGRFSASRRIFKIEKEFS